MRSTIRQLKPHSLSYQLTTLAQSPPSMAVEGASTIEECWSFLKSDETSSSWLTARMPRSSPLAASSKAALMSSAVVVLPSATVRSTTDTSRIGTRKERPANLPDSSGSTSATARFAPVEVGMMLSGAALVDVDPRLVRVGEQARRLDDKVDAKVFPRQLGRVLLRQELDVVAVDVNGVGVSLHGRSEGAERRVIFQEVGERLGVADVI